MRAVVLTSPGSPLDQIEVPDPVAPSGGSVIDVLACGICHSDLHAAAGDYQTALPVILGHEVAGLHPTLGPVLVYACWGCRKPDCWACSSGQEMICPNATEAGLFKDGGYAERMAIPDDGYLVPLGDLDPAQAAPLACGGLTAYRAVDHTLPFLSSAQKPRALVLGAGGLGQYGLQFIKLRSDAEVVVVDASPDKRRIALELGADHAVAPGEAEGLFTAVVDFVGADATLGGSSARGPPGHRGRRRAVRRQHPVRLRPGTARGAIHELDLGHARSARRARHARSAAHPALDHRGHRPRRCAARA